MSLHQLGQHVINGCPKFRSFCKLCNTSEEVKDSEMINLQELKSHLRMDCPKARLTCSSCKSEMTREAFEKPEHSCYHELQRAIKKFSDNKVVELANEVMEAKKLIKILESETRQCQDIINNCGDQTCSKPPLI